MKMKFFWIIGIVLMLVACGENEGSTNTEAGEAKGTDEGDSTEQTITYLDESYTTPKDVNNIITASLESMEDAAALGVKPVGAVTIAGELPDYLADDLEGAESIGEKMEPNYESVLSLKPDVILGSSKHQDDVVEQLNKIAPMIPYSHIATDWKDNLRLMGELSGKDAEAEQLITDYEKDAEDAKENISDDLQDKDVFVIRVRNGSLFVYPADVYLNPVIYEDLGFEVPEVVTGAKAQEEISLETLAEINPDVIFLQYENSENDNKTAALDKILEDPIFKSIDASKNDKVFVNEVDPLAQGGTAWSKERFLDAAVEKLSE
ncbi:iron complex transport system substrate-binding protein [Virgibacillus halotolerans]|uniref:ABC transporter substrate-binding protein n=1 Tax=Virgibacillus halotolerans TaxID=1071053 RepID=UPI0019600B75|nr:ABC transporter substrate-binding protein [Virgibacillus halotolerans]MBM7600970.1 iron complex transport system substrate-binding protein [Virgibacillus halotolerans]